MIFTRSGLCMGFAGVAMLIPLAVAASQPNTASQVRHHDVTWMFDGEHEVEQYITGDWWVVGPVEIIEIDPRTHRTDDGRVVHGSMADPSVGNDTGFDTTGARGDKYDEALNVAWGVDEANPLRLEPATSLLSAVSDVEDETSRALKSISILTVVEAAPPADAFRPPYMAVEKVTHRREDVDTSKLTQLEVVGEPPSWESVNESLARPFIDFGRNWNRYHLTPAEHPPPTAATPHAT